MHDYHAIEVLVRRLKSEVDGPVAEVRIRADVVYSPESLQQAFEMLTEGTPLAGSTLVVEESRREHTCESCGTAWTISRDDVAGHTLICPSCGGLSSIEHGPAIELLAFA